MSRHIFITSDESREVINGHAKEMAHAYGCDRSYYDQIVSGHETDGFEKFIRSLFIPALICGRPIAPWVTRLKLLEDQYRPLSKELCITKETAEAHEATSEAFTTALKKLPEDVQLRKVEKAMDELRDMHRALMQKINTPLYNGKPYDLQKRRGVS